MDNDSILKLAIESANTISIHNNITKAEDLSALIKEYFTSFKELLDDTTSSPQ